MVQFVYCADCLCVVNVAHIVSMYIDDKAVVAVTTDAQRHVELGYYDSHDDAVAAFDELVMALAKSKDSVFRMPSVVESLDARRGRRWR